VGSRVESCTCAKQIRVSWLSHKFGLIEVNKSVLCGFKNKVNIPVLCKSRRFTDYVKGLPALG
nr:hypothetical protein [Aulosira sp. DedVER01a]